MAFYCVFTIMHVALVLIVHPQYNIAHMMLNKNYNEIDAAQFAQAVTMLIVGVVVVLAVWIGASYWSHRDLRFAQTFVWGLTQPVRNLFLDRIPHARSRSRPSRTPIFRRSTGLTHARLQSVKAPNGTDCVNRTRGLSPGAGRFGERAEVA